MTLALRLRKWGGGGGNCFSPSFILAAGGRLELECHSLDRGRKRTGSSGRGKGAPRSPLTSPTRPPRSFGTLSQESRCQAVPLGFLGCWGGRVGAGNRRGREESQFAWSWQAGRTVLHAAHVGPISRAGLARRWSW